MCNCHFLVAFFLFSHPLCPAFHPTTHGTASPLSATAASMLRMKRSQGDFIQSSDTICERFSVPLANNTFFNPIDTSTLTDTYPPKVDCILQITGIDSLLPVTNRLYWRPSLEYCKTAAILLRKSVHVQWFLCVYFAQSAIPYVDSNSTILFIIHITHMWWIAVNQ